MPEVTVCIPVGPEPHHQEYLEECLASVRTQTHPANEILLIDDMANLVNGDIRVDEERTDGLCHAWSGPLAGCNIWYAPWRVGAASAINFGVALAKNELVYLLCGDDWLEPECLESCVEAFEQANDPLGYYHVTVRFRPEGDYQHPGGLPDPPIQDLP